MYLTSEHPNIKANIHSCEGIDRLQFHNIRGHKYLTYSKGQNIQTKKSRKHKELNLIYIVHQKYFTDIYGMFHAAAVEYTVFSNAQRMF